MLRGASIEPKRITPSCGVVFKIHSPRFSRHLRWNRRHGGSQVFKVHRNFCAAPAPLANIHRVWHCQYLAHTHSVDEDRELGATENEGRHSVEELRPRSRIVIAKVYFEVWSSSLPAVCSFRAAIPYLEVQCLLSLIHTPWPTHPYYPPLSKLPPAGSIRSPCYSQKRTAASFRSLYTNTCVRTCACPDSGAWAYVHLGARATWFFQATSRPLFVKLGMANSASFIIFRATDMCLCELLLLNSDRFLFFCNLVVPCSFCLRIVLMCTLIKLWDLRENKKHLFAKDSIICGVVEVSRNER